MDTEGKLLYKSAIKGIDLVEKYLAEAHRAPRTNIEACIKYLRAAQVAIEGLEREVDDILVESKYVALFDWEKRGELYRRIEQYVNVDRLRPHLAEAVTGMQTALSYAHKDADRFFKWSGRQIRKKQALEELNNLIAQVSAYLERLGDAMDQNAEAYLGPSGINKSELIEIQQLLAVIEDEPSAVDEQKQRILELAEACQASRNKPGLDVLGQTSGVIHRLLVSFGIEADQKDAH